MANIFADAVDEEEVEVPPPPPPRCCHRSRFLLTNAEVGDVRCGALGMHLCEAERCLRFLLTTQALPERAPHSVCGRPTWVQVDLGVSTACRGQQACGSCLTRFPAGWMRGMILVMKAADSGDVERGVPELCPLAKLKRELVVWVSWQGSSTRVAHAAHVETSWPPRKMRLGGLASLVKAC